MPYLPRICHPMPAGPSPPSAPASSPITATAPRTVQGRTTFHGPVASGWRRTGHGSANSEIGCLRVRSVVRVMRDSLHVSVHDGDLHDEVVLLVCLMVSANESASALSQREIDEVLGLAPTQRTTPTHGGHEAPPKVA